MNTILDPEVAARLARPGRREHVLAGMWDGKGTKEIAADLGISPKTVEYHRAVLYRRLNSTGRRGETQRGTSGREVEPGVYVPPEVIERRGIDVTEQLQRGVQEMPGGLEGREFGLEQAGRTNA